VQFKNEYFSTPFHTYSFLQYIPSHKPDTIISAAFSQSNHFSQVPWQIFLRPGLGLEELSRDAMANEIDLFVPFLLDLYSVSRRFVNSIGPDLFILIETDF